MKHQYSKTTSLTILLLYSYFFFEWLFFVTKPSFLTTLSVFERISVLFVAPLFTLVPLVIIHIALKILGQYSEKPVFSITVPIFILSALIFILIDNFTHTVFEFYVGLYGGIQRFGYFAFSVLVVLLTYLWISSLITSSFWQKKSKLIVSLAITLPLVSSVLLILRMYNIEFQNDDSNTARLIRSPNILILSTDGLDADNMSVYNYPRQTTPFISSWKNDLLISENSFTNNAQTTGSIAAILSGKLPTKTGLVYPPSIFSGVHIFQHFAGILKRHGYRNLEVGIPYYANSYDLNMRGAFDETAFRRLKENRLHDYLPLSLQREFSSELFFQLNVIERIRSRALHVLAHEDIVDPLLLVNDTGLLPTDDEPRLRKIFTFINKDRETPFFVHAHLMETHGPKFRPSIRFFSKNQTQNQPWMTNFYDDTILGFDDKVRRIVEFLKQRDQLDNTMIILTSDHGKVWSATTRIPLIIYFPEGLHQGQISFNTQRADIPPTILDFLGLDKPEWMDGDSLISGELDRNRKIFVTSISSEVVLFRKLKHGLWKIGDFSPPFFSMGNLTIIQCQLSYRLDLKTGEISKQVNINNHTNTCDPDMLLKENEAYDVMVKHLTDAGYDMNSFLTKH